MKETDIFTIYIINSQLSTMTKPKVNVFEYVPLATK